MNRMSKSEAAWSVPVAVETIADTGLHMDIEAPAEARAHIAEIAGLRGLPRLSAAFDLAKQGARVQVTGQVSATVEQTCVITLEPIENQIAEAVDLVFAPAGRAGCRPRAQRPRRTAGGADRRLDRSRRSGDRVPDAGHRSVSAQSRRAICAARAWK